MAARETPQEALVRKGLIKPHPNGLTVGKGRRACAITRSCPAQTHLRCRQCRRACCQGMHAMRAPEGRVVDVCSDCYCLEVARQIGYPIRDVPQGLTYEGATRWHTEAIKSPLLVNASSLSFSAALTSVQRASDSSGMDVKAAEKEEKEALMLVDKQRKA